MDLARRILAFDELGDKPSNSKESAVVFVYQKLRMQLCALTGVAGYRALLSRALALAQAEAPGLIVLEVNADGYMEGPRELDPKTDKDALEGEAILLAQFLGLLLTFVGEAVTLRLLRDVAPNLTVTTKPGTSSPFETILQEAERLQNLSERLELLGDQHPDVGDALLSISASISNTATLLEVLVHIKDESGGPQQKVPTPKADFYIM